MELTSPSARPAGIEYVPGGESDGYRRSYELSEERVQPWSAPGKGRKELEKLKERETASLPPSLRKDRRRESSSRAFQTEQYRREPVLGNQAVP